MTGHLWLRRHELAGDVPRGPPRARRSPISQCCPTGGAIVVRGHRPPRPVRRVPPSSVDSADLYFALPEWDPHHVMLMRLAPSRRACY
ncbi:hypothetical protein [Kutzneria sp. NPDC051319]|uniref:hypothetical protein n=1 Tax=Kutzneria sp. NPDC051319 TaxID=3155047 RepID=UPI00342C426D